jgi:hypothetical protein
MAELCNCWWQAGEPQLHVNAAAWLQLCWVSCGNYLASRCDACACLCAGHQVLNACRAHLHISRPLL